MKKPIFLLLLKMLFISIGISWIAFSLGELSPGDPAELTLSGGGNYAPTPEQISEMRTELGLDRPMSERYLRWLKNTMQLNWGVSYRSNQRIEDLFLEKFPVTLHLALFSMCLVLFFGIGQGILAAYFYHSKIDETILGIQNICLSFPQFWVGLILVFLFAEKFHILPTSGVGGFQHLLLPATTLSVFASAQTVRLTRSAFLRELGKRYYTYGILRGISKSKMFFTHVFKNAIVSVLPTIGNYFGSIIGGSAVVETIFALPGLGSLAIQSILQKDFPVVQSYVLFSGLAFLFAHSITELITIFLTPRMRRFYEK